MKNPKTGDNRFVPGIRPEEIETYTETNGDQSANYKIVSAHPIISGILDKLAFFRTHAAAVWYNRLAGKTVKQKFDEVDGAVGALNEKLDNKKIFKAQLVGNTKSLKDCLNEFLSKGDCMGTVVFNNPLDNVFADNGMSSGILTISYSVGYWRNNLQYLLQTGAGRLYIGVINMEDYSVRSITALASQSYVDKKFLFVTASGTTDNTGILSVKVENNFIEGKCFVLSNVANDLEKPWSIYVSGISNTYINVRFRKIVDHTALANTEIKNVNLLFLGYTN